MKKISTPSSNSIAPVKERGKLSATAVGPKNMTLAILRQFARLYGAEGAHHPSLRGFVAN